MPSSNETFRAAGALVALALALALPLVPCDAPAAAAAASGGAAAPALRLECPPQVRLDPKRTAVADAPAGFGTTVEAGPLWLTGLSVFDGPVEEGASLKPDRTARDGRATWQLGDASSWPRGVSLSCDYGPGLVHLARTLDPLPRECEARLSRSGSANVPTGGFSCR